ncbi:transcription factor ssl1 [Dictyocaulus viviparus]|uniref:Transcription factor ssl1 n=1 Tax=Dictyocaulus viviparus TaxID=29172 RepID=A0A0D8Y1E5_DICVI|nr:transcription factor ssl1 [Dictyocaulus viviparus]
MTEDDEQKGYTWEAGYADGLNIREVLEEDEGGLIEKSIAKLVAETKKKQRTLEKPMKIRLGIMRFVYIAIDCSRSMTSKVMPPSRFYVTMKVLNNFIDKFFEQNPIAQLGIILVKDKKAERFVSLTGRYDVVLDADHLDLLLSMHTAPPPSSKSTECNAIRVAFPPHVNIRERSFCVCHPMSSPISSRGFLCEQCGARHCSLPAECRVCRLTLISAPQLARAFRHLVPLPAFTPTAVSEGECMACERPLVEEGFMCTSCKAIFCLECDILLHESLHVCPNCT